MLGEGKIILVDGSAGTGKTQLIYNLLSKFIGEKFQYSGPILVCGVSNESINELTKKIYEKCRETGINQHEKIDFNHINSDFDSKLLQFVMVIKRITESIL